MKEGILKKIPQGEFRKAGPPTFDGESKTSQEVEAWIIGMNKYFMIHEYSRNEKARIYFYNLNGRASIWWDHLMQVKGIKERRII